jgi:hypothetical protein
MDLTGSKCVIEARNRRRPAGLGCLPGWRRLDGVIDEQAVGQLKDEIMMGPCREVDEELEPSIQYRPGLGSSRPAEVKSTGSGCPHSIVDVAIAHLVRSESGAGIEIDVDTGRSFNGHNPSEYHRDMRVAREGESVTALDHPAGGHPTTAPDERPLLIGTAPHETWVRRCHGVETLTPDERRKYRVGVPMRSAHPGKVTPWTNQDATFSVRE